jgi:FixJ family two-component response regulator
MADEIFYRSILNRDRLIHICDPNLSRCEQLSLLFRLEGFQTVFSTSLAEFLTAADRRCPNVVVANFDLGNEHGMDLLARVKAARNGTPVFMIENEPNVETAVRAMKAGASDVVTRPIDTEHLVRLVRETMRQDIHIGAVQAGGRSVEIRGFSQLTKRERQVLQLIINGQSNKAAGRELGISPRTVEVHRARIMKNLGAKNTADLMRIVLTS